MGIDNLPKSGIGFRASSGAGNFTRKFSDATRYGELRNLQDNKTAILKTIKKYEGSIRINKFDRLRQKAAYNQIRKMDNTLTKGDKNEIKQILKHLSPNTGSDKTTKSLSASPSSALSPAAAEPVLKSRIQRANVLSATRGYEDSLKLGSSASAKMIQARAFKKLEEAGGGPDNPRFSQGKINTGFAGQNSFNKGLPGQPKLGGSPSRSGDNPFKLAA